jgi:hypothetical protein
MFEMTGTESLADCDFIGFLASTNLTVQSSRFSYDSEAKILSYSFTLSQTIQYDRVQFVFDPTTLCISDSYNFIITTF